MADNVTIVDFHTHHIPARFEVTAGHTAIDLLGVDNVIAGSDWPIVEGRFDGKLTAAMRQAKLSDDEQRAVAAGNCQRLLGVH